MASNNYTLLLIILVLGISRTFSESETWVLRTPDERFHNLAELGYPWEPNYFYLQQPDHLQLRMHYIDEGPRVSKETILLLHGTPAWSFLYRKMIPHLLNAGYRVVAPDFIGFGRSDKLTDPEKYTHSLHVNSLLQLLRYLDLKDITLFAHDLGGPTGLSAVRIEPFRFKRLMLFNTWIPQGDIFSSPSRATKHAPYLSFRLATLVMGRYVPVRAIFDAVIRKTPKYELKGYTAPYPSHEFKVAPSQWPLLIPLNAHDSIAEEMKLVKHFLKASWKGPAIFGYSDGELFTTPGRDTLREALPYACEQDISDAGHFLQDDQGEKMAYLTIDFINNGCHNFYFRGESENDLAI